MIRVAILGVGWAGSRQVEAIREHGKKLSVYGLADNDPEFLREKAAEFGVERTYADTGSAIGDPDVDAVSICLPHALHCDVAVRALEAGKHVLVEKPIAMTVDEAERMMVAAERAGRRLYVAENLAYAPVTRFLKQVVETGDPVGEVVAASVVTGFRSENYGYPGRRAWLAQPEAGGSGHWLLNGIHTVAQIRAVFGEIAAVYATEHKSSRIDRTDVEGTLTLQMTTKSGFAVSVLQSREVYLKGGLRGITVYGDRGTLRATDEGFCVFGSDGQMGDRRPYPDSEKSDYAQEMEAFADYILTGKQGPTSAESETRSLAVVLAGYESVAKGAPCRV